MPRKMRHAALRSALSAKASETQIVVLDKLQMEQPKTRDLVELLERLGVSDSALVLLPDKNETVEKSARNIPDVKTLQASYLNVRDLLSYGTVLMPLDSLEIIQTVLG
jgi:large subunit ribosomal protein L4